LRDSVALDINASTNWITRFLFSTALQRHGYPAAQIELNRHLIALAPHDSLTHYVLQNMANSWAARGAWDSTLVAFDHWVAADHRGSVEPGVLPLIYQIVVAGAWLGGLDTARAADRRATAVKYIRGLPPGSVATMKEESRVAWADGMLAVLRRDRRELADARVRLRHSGAKSAPFMERSLAGIELELTGAKQAAAESLAALDLSATGDEISSPHDPYARSITHLAASRLLLAQGDTSRALKLLVWHEASVPYSAEPFRSQLFAGLAYYELARIEEAQGRHDLARGHYEQFLRRYDLPAPSHQYLVDEAKAALGRLSQETVQTEGADH
jgi:tetratricopeptide (TPR) repeat protein